MPKLQSERGRGCKFHYGRNTELVMTDTCAHVLAPIKANGRCEVCTFAHKLGTLHAATHGQVAQGLFAELAQEILGPLA